MATQILVKQLNKEVKGLRRDVAEIKTVLFKVLAIPEESIKDYRNAALIRTALRRARLSRPSAQI